MQSNNTKATVEVAVYMRTDQSKYYQIKIRSAVKRGVCRLGILEIEGESMQKDRQRVGALAGAMTEELCEKYGDSLDPDDVARQAMSAHQELVMETPALLWGDELPRAADRSLTQH